LEKCTELGLENLEARRRDQDVPLVTKYMTGQINSELFNNLEGQRRAGTGPQSILFARIDPRKYSFAVKSIEECNKLPINVRSAASSKSFRKRFKEHED
jgi:hypothetical protein